MALEVFANDGSATVSSGGTSAPSAGTVETWTLSVSTLPAVSSSASPPTQCYVADTASGAESEKILVTNISGSTATVTRGADGTTPVAHASGFTVQQVVTRASLQALQGALPLPSGTASAGEFPVATGTGNGTRWYPAVLYAPAPSNDTTGATDGPAVQGLINALNTLGGGKVQLQPGTYWGSLTLKSNVCVEGAERLATIWKLPNGANTDVIQGASFSSLTLGGTTGGISSWALRNMTIDGNKANQSGTSYGVRVYGYDFEIACVAIRNCLSDGLYTEWSGNSGGVLDGMEGHYREVKIHDCGGNGWHDRGPHDSRSWDVTIWNTGSTGIGYWAEGSNPTTVAAGSNGVDISTFTSGSPGTLNVATTLDFPAASISATQGAISVTTALGAVTVTYTGTTVTGFTGCVAQGASSGSTVSTGAAVAAVNNGFSAVGNLHTQMHVYGGSLYDYMLDTQVHLVDCIGEDTAANGAMVLLRFGNCMLTGGLFIVYSGLPKLGCGIQIGDAVNGASGCRIDTTLGGFGGTSAATAALNIVTDGGWNSIDLLVIQSSGTAIFGSPQRSSRVRVHSAGSGSTATDVANSLIQEYGAVARYVPSAAQQAWTLSPSSAPLNPAVNYRPPSNQLQFANGLTTRWYSDNFTTATGFLNGSTGQFSSTYMGATGLTGATAASRYVGATASGAPASGTFAVGDFAIDQSGRMWICTTAGSPGTWTQTGAGGGVTLDTTASDIQPSGVQAAGSTGKAADAAHVHQNNADLSMYLAPTGATGETFPRRLAAAYITSPVSGTVYASAIPLPKGQAVNNITLQAGNAAFSGVTHGWYALLDSGYVVRAVSADQTSGNWGTTFTPVTLSVAASAYTTTYAGLYYVAFCATFTGAGAFAGAANAAGAVTFIAPALYGASSSGQTTPPTTGTTLAAVSGTGSIGQFYAYTS